MRFAITVQNGSLAGKKVFLNGEYLTVGRSENCDLMFDPRQDRVVSSKHAYIENKPDGFYLVDNASTNGTFVNGEQIQRTRLKNNDVIQFGKNGPEAIISIEEPQQDRQVFQNQFQPPAINQQFQPLPHPGNWRNSVANFGLQNFEPKPQQYRPRKYIGVAIAIWALVFISLPIVALLIVGNLGIVAAFIAALVAFIPAVFYILPLILLDRYDPEPPWALAMAFAWGALVSVLFSAVVNDLVGFTVASGFGEQAGQLVSAVISAPVFEEGSKGLGVLLFLIFMRREFDDILDGIVYGGTIALGFATVENVLYYGRGLLEGGFEQLALLFFLRGILSPFAHVTFTAMTGIGCGISRESHNTAVRVIMPFLGYVCAVALHAVWNGMAFFSILILRGFEIGWLCESLNLGGNNEGLCAFLLAYAILEVPLFLIFVVFTLYIMRRQNRILREMLAIDVARGLITQDQLDKATSIFKSIGWLAGSVFTEKYRARRKFLRAVGKLGLSYWHIQRATAAQGQTASFQQNPILREEVLQWRDKV